MIKNSLLLLFVLLLAYPLLAQPARSRQKTYSAWQNNYQRVAGGLQHSLYIRNGTLWACGQNTDGRLGVNNTVQQNSFVQVGTDNDWVSVSGGQNHTLGLKSDGTLWAWGANGNGQLGLGAAAGTGNQLTPQRVGTDNKWISISAGAAHSMGLKSDGTLWVWGDNSSGQLGVGATPATSNVPVQVGTLTTWIAISAGRSSSLALQSDGSLWSWGYNTYGELGVGNTLNRNTPTRVGTDNDWISIAGGRYNNSALKSDGSLWAWGYPEYGPLGYAGTTTPRTTPIRIGTDNDWVHMSLGDHFAATKANGTLWVWGWNLHGQLGNGNATPTNVPAMAQLNASRIWAYGVATGFHTIAVERDGSVWVCGYNEFGQLGIGNNTNQFERNLIRITSPAPPVDWLGMSLGSDHTVGVKTDGTLWSWGKNDVGQLGVGDHISRNNAVQIGTDDDWLSVSPAYNSTLAFRMDGTLWGWGENSSGQLGIGNTISRDTPVQVGTERKWRRVVTGEAHALGIKADGTLWSWGSNAQGQTGGAASTTPQQVGSDNKWMNVSAGRLHSLGLKVDGTLWVWGANDKGQLGTGSTIQQNAPLQLGTDKNWAIVSAGADHSLALKTDGTLWVWGGNDQGQLGTGNTTQQTSPQQIGVDRDWIGIFAGLEYSLGLKSDGTLWGWGSNADGALGMGVIVNTTSPVQVPSQNDVVAISGSGGTHSGILKVNRDFICMTGGNGDGQLGDGTLVNKAEFVCNVGLVPCTLPPIVVTKSGADTFCVGDSIVLSVPDGYSYQWKRGTADVGHDSFYVAKQSGAYSVVVSNGACATTSPVITVVVNPLPPAVVTPSGPVSICQGDVLPLKTNNGTDLRFQWQRNSSGLGANDTFYNAASAGNYSVMVTDTQTHCFNISGLTELTVNPSPVATITPGAASAAICDGDTLVLGAAPAGGGITYKWMESNVLNGVTASSYPATASGNYAVIVTNSYNCSDTSSVVALTVNPLPVAILTPLGPVSFCEQDSVVLQAGSASGLTYQWRKDLVNIGHNSAAYTARLSGEYEVIVTDANLCTDTSDPVRIATHTIPRVSITPGDAAICSGVGLMLHAETPDTGLIYQWKDAHGNIPFASVSFYEVTASGSYAVEVQRNGISNCTAVSVPVQITVNPLPAPEIEWDGETLSTGAYFTEWQWYLLGQVLPFATSSEYIPDEDGVYSVTVTDTNGCINTSAPYHVKNVGVFHPDGGGDAVQIYPNPAGAMVYISAPFPVHVLICGMDGKAALYSEYATSIDLSSLATGAYLVRITDVNGMLVRYERLIKNE